MTVAISPFPIAENLGRRSALGRLLASRLACGCLLAAGGLQVVLAGAGVELWSCPFRAVTGCNCPGCGLSRSAAATLRADWAGVWAHHVFGPLAVVGLLVLGVSVVLPGPQRVRWSRAVEAVDRRAKLSVVFSVALGVYWVGRNLI